MLKFKKSSNACTAVFELWALVIFRVNWLKVIERSTEILGAVAKFSHSLSQLEVKQQRGEAFLLCSNVSNPQQNREFIIKALTTMILLMTEIPAHADRLFMSLFRTGFTHLLQDCSHQCVSEIWLEKAATMSRQDPVTLAAVELLANTPRSSITEVVNALQERLHLEEVPWCKFHWQGRDGAWLKYGVNGSNVSNCLNTCWNTIPMAMLLFIDHHWGPSFGDAAPRSLCIEHVEFAAFAPSSTGNMESGTRGLRLSVKWRRCMTLLLSLP